MRYSPEQQQNGQRAEKSAHGIDHDGYTAGISGEVGKETGCQHEDWVARGMAHLKLVCLDYKLSAIPIGSGRLKGEPIRGEGDGEYDPASHIVDQLIFLREHSEIVLNLKFAIIESPNRTGLSLREFMRPPLMPNPYGSTNCKISQFH